MRVKAKFIHKKSFIVAFASASSLLFATSAYALNTSNIRIHTDQASPEVELTSDQSEIVTALEIQEETADSKTTENNNAIQYHTASEEENQPKVDAHSSVVAASPTQVVIDASAEANVSLESTDDSITVVAGSESNNNSRMRVRVRNSSSSELNGEDQDGDSSFNLQIQENVTAD